jgi:DNA polymerase-3 subunit beta
LKFVATDRHRLAMLEQSIPHENTVQQLIVSARSLQEVNRLLPNEPVNVDIRYRENQILFKFANIQVFAKLLDGTYPDTDKIVQNSSNYSTELIVSTDAMIELMDRALILSKEEKGNVVKMYSLDTETIEITAVSSDFGKFKESLPTRKPLNNPVRISLNSKYMLDALRALDSEHVVIGFSGEMNPLLIRPLEEAEEVRALHLIVPYRTAKED